jgi:hypothetical protein
MSGLAARQEALVAALVAGGDVPAGFDPARVAAARAALLRKRVGEVARVWPLLAASLAARWPTDFAAWAEGRPPHGPLRDGWDFARRLGPDLPWAAVVELRDREAAWAYDGRSAPRRRPWPVRLIQRHRWRPPPRPAATR